MARALRTRKKKPDIQSIHYAILFAFLFVLGGTLIYFNKNNSRFDTRSRAEEITQDFTQPSVNLAWWYRPPTNSADWDSTAQIIADKFKFVVLTHGDEDFRDLIKEKGYSGKSLEYIMSREVNGPRGLVDSTSACLPDSYTPRLNNIAFEKNKFCDEIHPNEDWFLHRSDGTRIFQNLGYIGNNDQGVMYQMNPASPGWRNYVAASMRKMVTTSGWDGVFMDNVTLNWNRIREHVTNSNGTVKEFPSNVEYRKAMIGMLENIYRTFNADGKLVWGNMIDERCESCWNEYIQHMDGGMFEGWATGYVGVSFSPDRWENDLRQAEAVQSMGKGIIAVGQTSQENRDRAQFQFVSYLLIKNRSSAYFRATRTQQYKNWWPYDFYEKKLGKPISDRYTDATTQDKVWIRDFECGKVSVNLTMTSNAQYNSAITIDPACVPGATPTPTNTPTPTSTPTPTNTPSPTPTIPPPTTDGGPGSKSPVGTGLRGYYFDDLNFRRYISDKTDPKINFDWGYGSPNSKIESDSYSIRWTGYLVPQYSANYTFYLTADDGVRIWVDGKLLIDEWHDHRAKDFSGSIFLIKDKKVPIRIDYYENRGNSRIELQWSTPGTERSNIPTINLYPQ